MRLCTTSALSRKEGGMTYGSQHSSYLIQVINDYNAYRPR